MNMKQAEKMKTFVEALIVLSTSGPEEYEYGVTDLVTVTVREGDDYEQWVQVSFSLDHVYEAQGYFDQVLKVLKALATVDVISQVRPSYSSSRKGRIVIDLVRDETLRAAF